MDVQVSFRGKPQRVEGLDSDTRVSHLKEKLEELTTVPARHQKLILKGKVLQSDDITLEEAGVVSKSMEADGNVKYTQAARLMLVGSTTSEVQLVHELKEEVVVRNDLHGKAIPKGYKKVALNDSSPRPAHWRYRFQRIETLPGLPNEDKARDILESLANDPGVCSVLEKHRWTVGALCELYPEGKVGVSRECVMGLNQNHGQKILLRLRTDDLKGFRKILSIRKVLFHELAHNDISDHDDNFYRLMRQVEREAAELDWRQQSGRRLRGGETRLHADMGENERGYTLVKEAFEGGSGRLGGDSEGLTHMFSAQQLAGQAAVLRLTPEEQEVEDCCGHTKGNHGAAASADTGRATTVFAGDTEENKPAHRVELDENEANGSDSDRLGETKPSGLSLKTVVATDAANDRTSDMENDVCHTEEHQHVGCEGLSTAVNGEDKGVGVDGGHGLGMIQEGMALETAGSDGDPVASSTLQSQYGNQGIEEAVTIEAAGSSSASSEIPTAMDVVEDAPQVIPQTVASPLDDLVAMGFPRDAAEKALIASGGSVPDATYRLLTPGVSDTVVVDGNSPADDAFGGVGGGEGPRLSRDVRVQQAAERIAGYGDRSKAMKVLEVMFRNIMEHPSEEKFRRVRRSNGKFKASVGSVPEAVELLLAAGFEARGADLLELGRQDTGLIWLARSTVEGWRERLSAGVHAKSIAL